MSNLTPRINRLESNLIIDGAMEIWPEGTSRAIAATGSAYGSVLFRVASESGVALTNSRQTSVPAGTNLQFSNQISKTTAGTLAAGTSINYFYVVEGFDLTSIINSEFTVLFWVRSSVASNRSVGIRNGTSSHSYLRQYNISQANTWELKALRFPAMSTCPGVLDRGNGAGMRLTFNVISGSSFETSSVNQWVSGTFFKGAGEDTTWLTGTNHDFSIAGAMVLPGNWEGLAAAQYSFVRAGRNFEDELAMTQRYYEKSYDLETPPGSNTRLGWLGLTTGVVTTSLIDIPLRFSVPKRTLPVMRSYDGSGNIDRHDRPLTATNKASGSFPDLGVTGGLFRSQDVTSAAGIALQWTADARF